MFQVTFWTRFSTVFLVCLLFTGCPTPDGGDPAVWHDQTINGTGELLSVTSNDNSADSEISIRFTYEGGSVDEKPLEGLKLASIVDLPNDYQPEVGDQLRLKMELRYKRKMSVGPPDFLHSRVDKRTFTCLEVMKSNEKTVAVASPASNNDVPATGSSLVWETTGGGQIRFTLTPDQDEFKVHVDKFGPHQELDMILAATDGAAYEAAKSVMTSPVAFQLEKSETPIDPNTPPPTTGTWTSIHVIDSNGQKIDIDRSKPGADFRALYDLVKAAAEKNDPPMEPDSGPEPPPVPPESNDDGTSADPSATIESGDSAVVVPHDPKGADETNKDGQLTSDEKPKTAKASMHPYEIDKLIWQTTGGGQIDFTIIPDQDNFKIHLASYGFEELPLDLVLTADDAAVHATVKSIFDKKRDLQKDTFTPGGPTGTWTTITLLDVDQTKTEIKNVSSSSGDLRKIYDFVANAARESKGEEPLPQFDDNPDK